MNDIERRMFAAAFAQEVLACNPGAHTYANAERAASVVLAWRVFRGRRQRGPATVPEVEAIFAAADFGGPA